MEFRSVSSAIALCACLTLGDAGGVTITENFATHPLAGAWRVFGDTNLFQWNTAGQTLDVTWDSSRSNSYFYLPLGTILNRADSFSAAFDLKLTDFQAGINPAKPSTFQLAVGFLNLLQATNGSFFRGNAAFSPNLVEFDFFPDTGFGPTVWPSIWSTNSSLNYNGAVDYAILDLPTGSTLHIVLSYSAADRSLNTSILSNSTALGPIPTVRLSSSFTDFSVGAFAIASYSDAGQDPQYGGSLLAHGQVDNITLVLPPPPVQNLKASFVANQWKVTFLSHTNWYYVLERSTNLISWSIASAPANGNGATLSLQDTNPVGAVAWYRVNALRP